MSRAVVYREVKGSSASRSGKRSRSSRVRTPEPSGFGRMLSMLGLASSQLQQSRGKAGVR